MTDLFLIVLVTYPLALYLSYLQWLSDDSNFDPYKPFGD